MMMVEVLRVIDGDTLEVLLNNQKRRIRLLLVDTPEITKGKNEPYGQEAKQHVWAMLQAVRNRVTIEIEGMDKYGRLLAHVFAAGVNLQKSLLTNGLAKYAYDYGDYKYENEYREAERQAREKQRGIWSIAETAADVI
jgi:micrococcal nuclease